MLIPEGLYYLTTARQVGTAPIEFVCRERGDAATAAIVQEDIYTVPGDRVLVLSNAAMRAFGGAGSNRTFSELTINPPSAVAGAETIAIHMAETPEDGSTADNWQGEVWVPPLWTIEYKVTFSSAVVENGIRCAIQGLLIPLGSTTGNGAG